jgi:hypothetical protein
MAAAAMGRAVASGGGFEGLGGFGEAGNDGLRVEGGRRAGPDRIYCSYKVLSI